MLTKKKNIVKVKFWLGNNTKLASAAQSNHSVFAQLHLIGQNVIET